MRQLAALFLFASIASCDDIQDTDGSTTGDEPDHTPTTSSSSNGSTSGCHVETEEDPQIDINCQTEETEVGPLLVCETCIGLEGRSACVPSCDPMNPCERGEVCVFQGCLPSCDPMTPCPKGQECQMLNGVDACWPA